MSQQVNPTPVPEFRRLVVGESADVTWHVSRRKDGARLDLHDRLAPARRSLIGSLTIPYAEAVEMRAVLNQMVLTAPDDWAVRASDRAATIPRMPALGAPRKVKIPAGVEIEWTARLTDGTAVVEARVGREGLLAIEAPVHELPRLMAMLGTLPGAHGVDGRAASDVELRDRESSG